MSSAPPPEAVLLIGVQATGKSSFVRARLFDTHLRINLDMLRTRHREQLILDSCLAAGQPFVVDNTNPTRAERARYIEPARAAGFTVTGFYFQSAVRDALRRNAARNPAQRVPELAVRGTHARLELPERSEGFDRLYYVTMTTAAADPTGGQLESWTIQEWRDEVR